MTALSTITLNDEYTADAIERNGQPVLRLFQNGHITPGQWYASTIASRPEPTAPLYIDHGANWKIDSDAAQKLYAFALQTLVDAGLL